MKSCWAVFLALIASQSKDTQGFIRSPSPSESISCGLKAHSPQDKFAITKTTIVPSLEWNQMWKQLLEREKVLDESRVIANPDFIRLKTSLVSLIKRSNFQRYSDSLKFVKEFKVWTSLKNIINSDAVSANIKDDKMNPAFVKAFTEDIRLWSMKYFNSNKQQDYRLLWHLESWMGRQYFADMVKDEYQSNIELAQDFAMAEQIIDWIQTHYLLIRDTDEKGNHSSYFKRFLF